MQFSLFDIRRPNLPLLLLLATAFIVLRCTNAQIQWSGLEFSYEDDQITVARGRVFSLAIESLDGDLTFTSSDPSVGTISTDGVYSALTAGTTTVSVSDGLGGSDSIVISTPTTGLDSSFGTSNGYSLVPIGGNDAGHSVSIGGDGNIALCGFAFNTDRDFAISLFDSQGNIQPSFPISQDISTTDNCEDVVFDTNGKIVAAGRTSSGFGIVRYERSGSPDGSFNLGNPNTSGGSNHAGFGLVEEPDGSLSVVGREFSVPFNEFSFARFSPSGITSTGSPFSFSRTSNELIYDAIMSNNGTIVAVGSSASALAIAQFDPGASFALLNLNTFPAGTEARAVLRDEEGNIYAVGKDGTSLFVQKTDSSVNPLKSSSIGFPATWNGEHVGAAMLPNGYLVMVAETNAGLAMAMVTQNLDADTQFNPQGTTPGTMLVDLSGVTLETATSVAIDTLGRIVVGGYASNGTDNDFLVARFWP